MEVKEALGKVLENQVSNQNRLAKTAMANVEQAVKLLRKALDAGVVNVLRINMLETAVKELKEAGIKLEMLDGMGRLVNNLEGPAEQND